MCHWYSLLPIRPLLIDTEVDLRWLKWTLPSPQHNNVITYSIELTSYITSLFCWCQGSQWIGGRWASFCISSWSVAFRSPEIRPKKSSHRLFTVGYSVCQTCWCVIMHQLMRLSDMLMLGSSQSNLLLHGKPDVKIMLMMMIRDLCGLLSFFGTMCLQTIGHFGWIQLCPNAVILIIIITIYFENNNFFPH